MDGKARCRNVKEPLHRPSSQTEGISGDASDWPQAVASVHLFSSALSETGNSDLCYGGHFNSFAHSPASKAFVWCFPGTKNDEIMEFGLTPDIAKELEFSWISGDGIRYW
jgi:hypothetical protein